MATIRQAINEAVERGNTFFYFPYFCPVQFAVIFVCLKLKMHEFCCQIVSIVFDLFLFCIQFYRINTSTKC